jgi:hypothetical protein
MIRDLITSDLTYLESYHPSFPIPNVNNKHYITQKVIDLDGRIIGSGMIKLTTESILILDPSLSKITKVKVLCSLINVMKNELKHFGLDDTHVFLTDPEPLKTEKVLLRLGFIPAEGKALYLGV